MKRFAQNFDVFLNLIDDLLGIIDLDSNILKLSPGWDQKFGYHNVELEGKRMLDFIHPEDLDSFRLSLGTCKKLLLTRTFVSRFRNHTENYQWLEFKVQYSADQDYFLLRARDINSEKRHETLLRHLEKISEIGTWEVNVENNDVYWSETIYELRGLPLSFKPKLDDALGFYDPEDRATVKEAFEQQFVDGKPFDLEARMTTAEGRLIWVRLVSFADMVGDKIVRSYGTLQDITDQKFKSEEIRELTLSYINLKEALDELAIIAITNVRGQITYCNQKFIELSGYTRQELVGKDHRIVNSGFHTKDFFRDLWKTIASGKNWRGQLKNRAKDGSYYWVETIIHPLLDSNGKVKEYLSFRTDITERKNRELLDIAVSKVKAIYFEMLQSPSNFFTSVIEILLELTGADFGAAWEFEDGDEHIQFKDFPRFKGHRDRYFFEVEEGEFDRLLTDTGHVEKILVSKKLEEKGELNLEALLGFPLYVNEKLTAILTLNNDGKLDQKLLNSMGPLILAIEEVLSLYQLESDRQEKKNQLELLAYSSELGLWDWDLITNNVSYNDRLREMLGYEKFEYPNEYSTFEKYLHPDDQEKARLAFTRYLNGEHPVYEVKIRMLHKLGHWVPILSKGKVIKRDQNGRPIRFAGTHFDLTYMEQIEKNLQEQREIALHSAKLASIGVLAAGIGHEINNPLAIVQGYLERVNDIMREENFQNQQVFKLLSKIDLATNRIASIVRGLRVFSRCDTDLLADFELGELLLETFEMVNDIYKNNGIELELKNETAEKLIVYGNRGRIQQVLVNLLSNARDATEGKSPRVIILTLQHHGAEACISVEDNGTGIPEDIKAKIFEPFFTTKEVNKGTGIGLSLVNSIVKEHRGDIQVHTEVGRFTRFTVSLPLKNQELNTEKRSLPVEDKYALNCSAILAEDEEDLREILAGILGRLGVSLKIVGNGQEAWEAFNQGEYDLVISDLEMPVMDGYMLLEKISTSARRKPSFIVVSGAIKEESADLLINKVDGIIHKPFKREVVYQVLKKALDNAKKVSA